MHCCWRYNELVYQFMIFILFLFRDKEFDLSPYSQKIHYVLNKLKIQLIVCHKQIGGLLAYFWLLEVYILYVVLLLEMKFKALLFLLFDADEAKNHRYIINLLRRPTEIMEVFKGLIFTKDNVQPLIDGSTKQTVYKSLL